MTRTVIERRNFWAIVFLVVSVIMIVILAVCLWFLPSWPNIFMVLLGIVQGGLLLAMGVSVLRFEKEMIILDDAGLTLNGEIKLGPIPWDCISDVSIRKWSKVLSVGLTNMNKIVEIFGEDVIRDKIGAKRSNVRLEMMLDFCKMKGIDLEALIKERINGKTDRSQ